MPEPLTAVLERGRQVLLPNGHSQWVDLLKSSLSRTDRATCPRGIGATVPVIAEIGGTASSRAFG
jgi:hypothetical protein